MTWAVHVGDCLSVLRSLADETAQTCVTSPPYWNLRDYGCDGQMGLEETPDQYVDGMVAVFREVRRVLRDDGTLWLNLGDSYAGSWGAQSRGDFYPGTLDGASSAETCLSARQIKAHPKGLTGTGSLKRTPGLKNKDLVGIPWRVAFALQADGWFLRSDIIWHKPNPMPESVVDRPTKAHEYVFLLAKSERYHYGAAEISEPTACPEGPGNVARVSEVTGERPRGDVRAGLHKIGPRETRNRRTVWSITTKPFPGSHFATMPLDLAEPCVLAGAPEGGVVLDPFTGSGTTGVAAVVHHRHFIGAELNPEYASMARHRIGAADPIGRQEGLFA